jgi:hypothetical protein
MGKRIAVWLDDDLEERLNQLLNAMQERSATRDLGITKSAVIKAALTKGLPFMELDHLPLSLHKGDELKEWMDWAHKWLGQWYDTLDWEPGKPIDWQPIEPGPEPETET